jgi:DNA end-binding protein Ku
MPASVWTGYLTFGLISMPVRLFSGARSSRVSFHMLHRDDNTRIKQQLYCPADNRVVERSEIVKGYEYQKGVYVIVEPQEIKKIEPKTAQAMEILEFVKAGEIDPIYFDASYYLLPEEAGRRPYALLARALRESDYVAIAKLAMHNREYTVFLRPYEKGIMLHTMYYKDELSRIEQLSPPDLEVKEAELKIAGQLIHALEAKFEPEKYHDTFEENLKQLIKARLEGKHVTEVEKERKPAPVVDLMAALKQSLSTMEKGKAEKKPASRVEQAQQESRIHVVGEKPGAAKSKKKRAA